MKILPAFILILTTLVGCSSDLNPDAIPSDLIEIPQDLVVKIQEDFAKRDIKRQVLVELNRKVSQQVLRSLAYRMTWSNCLVQPS